MDGAGCLCVPGRRAFDWMGLKLGLDDILTNVKDDNDVTFMGIGT